jgi:DNA repair photolyase
MKIRQSAVVKKYHRVPGRVMFPSSHDIVDLPEIEHACFSVLMKLLASGNDVLVTTKPRLGVVQKIVGKCPQYRDRLQFRFTITSKDDHLLNFWEPNAPPFKERMACLEMASAEGYKTSVSIEPFLDPDPQTLVELVAPYSTESIWIGIMNYIPRNGILPSHAHFYNAIRKNCEKAHLMRVYEKLKDFPKIRFKDSIRFRLNL